MINPISLFLGFTGRIGRLAWWFGLIVLVLLSPFSIWTFLSTDPFTDAIRTVQTLGWQGAAWMIALFIPLAALNTKRLHDLGRSGIFAVLFYAPAALATIELFVGDSISLGQWEKFRSYADWAIWLAGGAGIWFLVQLGLYGGTRGPNKYGTKGAQEVDA